MKLKILYRKNLDMSPGKIAAQAVHAAIAIRAKGVIPVIVLGVSNSKFESYREQASVIINDAGVTEVEPGTETCLAFYEQNDSDQATARR